MAKKVKKHQFNVPYVVERDPETGKVLNPIEKGDPYMSMAKTRRDRRFMEFKYPSRKEQPIGLIVYKNAKDRGLVQRIKVVEEIKTKDPKDKRKTLVVHRISWKKIYHRINADGYVTENPSENEENTVN